MAKKWIGDSERPTINNMAIMVRQVLSGMVFNSNEKKINNNGNRSANMGLMNV